MSSNNAFSSTQTFRGLVPRATGRLIIFTTKVDEALSSGLHLNISFSLFLVKQKHHVPHQVQRVNYKVIDVQAVLKSRGKRKLCVLGAHPTEKEKGILFQFFAQFLIYFKQR